MEEAETSLRCTDEDWRYAWDQMDAIFTALLPSAQDAEALKHAYHQKLSGTLQHVRSGMPALIPVPANSNTDLMTWSLQAHHILVSAAAQGFSYDSYRYSNNRCSH